MAEPVNAVLERETKVEDTKKLEIFNKFENPQKFREFYINNFIDEVSKIPYRADLKTSLSQDDLKAFYELNVSLLAAEQDDNELLSLFSRQSDVIDKIIEKFGCEKAKPMLAGTIPAVMGRWDEINEIKKIGATDIQAAILTRSIEKSVDDIATSKEKGVEAAKAEALPAVNAGQKVSTTNIQK